MPRDSVPRTLTVAAILCIVCSVIVSAAAVGLRPRQEKNKKLFQQKNILEVLGLKDPKTSMPAAEVSEKFADIDSLIVDLESGTEATEEQVPDPDAFDSLKAAKDPALSMEIPPEDDIATIKRREKFARVYLYKKDGKLENVVLPVYGKGLWSTLYGFIALESDLKTVKGITFYKHGETPGLGGEVDNPTWKAKWPGKNVYGENGEVKIEVIKGAVTKEMDPGNHMIDGMSGATITSRGVSNLVEFWLGDAFGPYLEKLRNQSGDNNG